jgi:hypothetical protein
MEALSVIGPIIRDRQVTDKVLAAEAAWNLVGFGLAQAVGHNHTVGALPEAESPEIALEEMEAMANPEPGMVAAFNPQKFLQNALKILQVVIPLLT